MGVDNIAANLPEGMKLWKIAVTPVEQAKLQQALAQMRSTSINTESVPSPIATPSSKLTRGQQHVMQRLWAGDSMFLTGGAGTGKTFLIRRFVTGRKNVLLFAPTGKAAVNLGGVTLHSFFKASIGIIDRSQYLKPKDNPAIKLGDENAAILRAAEIIIIDEVSMCRADLFEYVMSILKAAEYNWNKSYQIIVTGDFYQLPPIVPNKNTNRREREAWELSQPDNLSGWAFKSPAWEFDLVSLHEVVRQKDEDFSGALNLVRIGDKNGISWIEGHCCHNKPTGNYMTIASRNDVVKSANEQKLNALKGNSYCYKISVPQFTEDGVKNDAKASDWKSVCEETLEVRVHARVMCLCNYVTRNIGDGTSVNLEKSFYNGETGTVTKMTSHSVTVHLDRGAEIEIERHKWYIYGYRIKDEKIEKIKIGEFEQIPLRLAWASTVHKAQGMTYTSPIYIDTSSPFFVPGMAYVALSRVTTIEHLYLSKPLDINSRIASPEVQEFYGHNNR